MVALAHDRDGQPREVVRNGDDVVCYLPALATVRVDKYSEQNKFPAVLPAQLKELLENYDIRRGGMERVAGFDCDVLTLEPKDNRRYGHKLWVDVQTGMLIKAKTYDGRHEAMEQFTFSHLQFLWQQHALATNTRTFYRLFKHVRFSIFLV